MKVPSHIQWDPSFFQGSDADQGLAGKPRSNGPILPAAPTAHMEEFPIIQCLSLTSSMDPLTYTHFFLLKKYQGKTKTDVVSTEAGYGSWCPGETDRSSRERGSERVTICGQRQRQTQGARAREGTEPSAHRWAPCSTRGCRLSGRLLLLTNRMVTPHKEKQSCRPCNDSWHFPTRPPGLVTGKINTKMKRGVTTNQFSSSR